MRGFGSLASIKTLCNSLLILMFLLSIGSSGILMLFSEPKQNPGEEKRLLSTWPGLPKGVNNIHSYFSGINDYLNDHFGLRAHYIYRYKRELQKLFGRDNVTPRVIEGVDGWLFYNKFRMIDDFLGFTPLSAEQLDWWLASVQEKNKWLQEQGIRYLLVVIPNKQAVYPEYVMKDGVAMKGISRFEQLQSHLKGKQLELMPNLHLQLQPERYEKPLYYKYDSHWTQFGAYIGFTSIMELLQEWFPREEFVTGFTFGPDKTGTIGNTGPRGDLARLILQPFLEETYPELQRFKRCEPIRTYLPYEFSNLDTKRGSPSFIRTCKKKNLRGLVFRDSFFVPVEPLLSENFQEVVYLWKSYDQTNVEELLSHYKPDIVIEAVAERHMFDTLPPAIAPE